MKTQIECYHGEDREDEIRSSVSTDNNPSATKYWYQSNPSIFEFDGATRPTLREQDRHRFIVIANPPFSPPLLQNAVLGTIGEFDVIASDVAPSHVTVNRENNLNLKKQIRDLSQLTVTNNWDGDDAVAVSQSTIENALTLVDLLPIGVDEPEIAPTPHGEIDFDWMDETRTMLTISVCPDGGLAWAARCEDFNCRGKTPCVDNLPPPLLCCLQRFSP